MQETNFPINLRILRIKNKLKINDLAVKLNVSPSAVSSWERGIHSPPLEYISILTELFNVSSDELLGISSTQTLVSSSTLEEEEEEDIKLLFNSIKNLYPLNESELTCILDTIELIQLRRIRSKS